MAESTVARLRGLPVVVVLGREVPIATGFRVRLLGLSHLDREEAGPGLLIPRCFSVHTFGMRFPLDLYFLNGSGVVIEARRSVPSRRLALCRFAAAVLELPSPLRRNT
jgi:uncharacterized membrane protein (UPF0127 family)